MADHGWKHDDLAADLAAHLRGYAKPAMIWTDMQLGPVGSARPDVYSIDPTYSRFIATAYEVKISRSDFLSDVSSGKALRYLKFAGSLVFAVPKGMIRKDELPDGCGLLERSETGWRYAKKSKVNPIDNLPRDAWMKLLIDGVSRCEMNRRDPGFRVADPWRQHHLARKLMGDELAKMIQDRHYARLYLEQEIEKLKKEREVTAEARQSAVQRQADAASLQLAQINQLIIEAGRGLGLKDDEIDAYAVRKALERMRPEGDRKAVIEAARIMKSHADWVLRHASEMEKSVSPETESKGDVF